MTGCRVVQIGEGSAYLCGGESDHICNSNLSIYTFSDGTEGTLFDKAVEVGLNPQMCDEDKQHFLYERGIDIRGWSSGCSICGRMAKNDLSWL